MKRKVEENKEEIRKEKKDDDEIVNSGKEGRFPNLE